jgi:hypothetical protein
MTLNKHIRGRDATYVAIENDKRKPIAIGPAPNSPPEAAAVEPPLPAPMENSAKPRTPPPRIRKPSRLSDQVLAPTQDLEGHRAALRGVFATLSEEFSQTMFGKLVALLRPNPFEHLDEATLNAAIALVASMQPQNELQAVLAVEIAGTAFAGQKFLRQSQHHLDEIFINVYGGYALKLLRLQLEMIQALDRLQRGNKQTVEVRHVHIHPGAQGVVGIVNGPQKREGDADK